MSFAERVLKKARKDSDATISKHADTRFIVPTCNVCEKLFSFAGYALGDRGKGLLPANFEMLLFFHFNAHLWRIQDIQDILHETLRTCHITL